MPQTGQLLAWMASTGSARIAGGTCGGASTASVPVGFASLRFCRRAATSDPEKAARKMTNKLPRRTTAMIPRIIHHTMVPTSSSAGLSDPFEQALAYSSQTLTLLRSDANGRPRGFLCHILAQKPRKVTPARPFSQEVRAPKSSRISSSISSVRSTVCAISSRTSSRKRPRSRWAAALTAPSVIPRSAAARA